MSNCRYRAHSAPLTAWAASPPEQAKRCAKPGKRWFWKGCKPISVCPDRSGERIICLSSQYPEPAPLARKLERAAPKVPYLALHPMGFSVPRRLRFARCALTAPFHPYPERVAATGAVCFLWHCPSGCLAASAPVCISDRIGVTRHRALWSSDFPPPARAGSDSPPFQNH